MAVSYTQDLKAVAAFNRVCMVTGSHGKQACIQGKGWGRGRKYNVQNSPIGRVGLCGPASLGTCKNS